MTESRGGFRASSFFAWGVLALLALIHRKRSPFPQGKDFGWEGCGECGGRDWAVWFGMMGEKEGAAGRRASDGCRGAEYCGGGRAYG